MCYLAPLTNIYRNKCIEDWKTYVSSLKIPCSAEFSFRKVLESDIKIQSWNIAGLPNDSFSVENAIIVEKSRRLYLTSKLRNPHFLPDVFNRVTVVNFALTQEGLEDQLLGIVVAKERPDLEERRRNLIVESAANETALKNVEDSILITLSETKGNILEDESAINVLDSSKALAQDIMEKEATAQETASTIDSFRLSYRPVAQHSAILYYCLTDLPNVDPMYQYSLGWFINLYTMSIEGRFFLVGVVTLDHKVENPAASWLPDKCWENIRRLNDLPSFDGFVDSFKSSLEDWKIFYKEVRPDEIHIPEPWNKKLSNFQKLMIMRIFHPDKILLSVQHLIEKEMGKKYVTPPTFDIAKSYTDSNCLCPLIFILSPGADPMSSLTAFSRKLGKKLETISLGQGQGPIAQNIIEMAQKEGSWVCLQNCHLAMSWMPTLEKLWEEMSTKNTSLSFRLWLTSYPSDKFPSTILQASVKITNEAPTGLQQNLLRSFLSEPLKEPEFFSGCPGKEKEFSRLLYALCFFHAVVQERRKFGAIGWNISYGFDESDFHISIQQLQMFINEQNKIPFEAISYLTGECNYGGRVTDDWDRRTLKTILADFINENVITDPNYVFSSVGRMYGLPNHYEYRHFLRHIKNVPSMPPPEVFGLNMNAGITRDLHSGKNFLSAVLEVHGGLSNLGNSEEGDGRTVESVILEIIKDILNKLPHEFDLELAKAKYPVRYEESLNTVLIQEMERFNKLLNTIYAGLDSLQKALKGFVTMSSESEAISSALLVGRVPSAWTKVSYPSLKPLGSYIGDLSQRLNILKTWYTEGKPSSFWLPGFFFAQSFLTGVMQNFARKVKVPIEQLTFDYIIASFDISSEPPEDGCYIHGLFLDGARWDKDNQILGESYPKVLWELMPAIHVNPTCKENMVVGKRYVCPLYKTSERHGILSTTGHSNNYIFPLLLTTDQPASHWIKRGVALLCQLDD
ncbi:Dynein heavy chain 7 [Blattella germanica]|nr:Dynein heavy chain 7 [Blattella germanica]